MDRFEYAVGLISIVIGLALTHVAGQLHRLMTAEQRPRLRVIPFAAAGYLALLMMHMWYLVWSLRGAAFVDGFWFLASLTAEFLILFLAMAAVLPEEPKQTDDLATYYWRRSRYVWGVAIVFQLSVLSHSVYISSQMSEAYWAAAHAERLLTLALFIGLFVFRRPWLHGTLLAMSALDLIRVTLTWRLSDLTF